MDQAAASGHALFDDVPASPADARRRDSLLLMALLRWPGLAEPLPVRVRNLSEGGLMAELPTAPAVGTAVEVEVRGIGWVGGEIAWHTQGRVGIAFATPIDPRRARKPVGSRRGR
jgi:hypothetical protein